jgi:hypothetical protein
VSANYTIQSSAHSSEKFSWYEADVPWDDLDEEGVTEPEPVFDTGPDSDISDDE